MRKREAKPINILESKDASHCLQDIFTLVKQLECSHYIIYSEKHTRCYPKVCGNHEMVLPDAFRMESNSSPELNVPTTVKGLVLDFYEFVKCCGCVKEQRKFLQYEILFHKNQSPACESI